MKQSITFLKQVCVLLLFVSLAACGSGEKEGLRSEIEQTMAEISDELTALKAVTMEQQGVLDGLKEDLKWEYSEGLDKLVSQYGSEFSMLKENIDEMNGIYDAVAGYQEKLGGAPLEYSMSLIKELLEENRERFEELAGENEAIQEKFYDLADQLDELGAEEAPVVSAQAEEDTVSQTADVSEETVLSETTESAE
ncbi:hypothetical protein [Prosthecochloris sp.]|jgi:hypothetical protein|uniref:hypothetical protein n=1 Tax=Prosthecochloris sp. TaxID=290513 RepID=UPI0025CF515E|nr:hypothetical protein [Prosthecochloris sp.]